MEENRIREMRRSHKLTQEQLAERVGASVRQISYWEHGKGLSLRDAAKLADVFGCSIDDLVGRTPREASPGVQRLRNVYEALNSEGRKHLLDTARAMSLSGMFARESDAEPAELYGLSVVRLFEGKPKAMFSLKTEDREEALKAFDEAVSRADAERIEWLRLLKIDRDENTLDYIEEWKSPSTNVAWASWE